MYVICIAGNKVASSASRQGKLQYACVTQLVRVLVL